jgi:hypothetical protein
LGCPLLLAAIMVDLDFIAAFVHVEHTLASCAALGIL